MPNFDLTNSGGKPRLVLDEKLLEDLSGERTHDEHVRTDLQFQVFTGQLPRNSLKVETLLIMPTISVFYGIQEPKIISGTLPQTAERLVLEWAQLHQAKLMENWLLCERQQTPAKIDPLP
ncbi:MAG: DUF4160 domain-containing protein [Acidobacteriaceae bacterium]|nr:DUF4160 domain-containing protein [Acidobacteriaceae bacterium]MBV9309169.1 DUF4160 domain-containing protein [Acidobacteriaceae bacterium]